MTSSSSSASSSSPGAEYYSDLGPAIEKPTTKPKPTKEVVLENAVAKVALVLAQKSATLYATRNKTLLETVSVHFGDAEEMKKFLSDQDYNIDLSRVADACGRVLKGQGVNYGHALYLLNLLQAKQKALKKKTKVKYAKDFAKWQREGSSAESRPTIESHAAWDAFKKEYKKELDMLKSLSKIVTHRSISKVYLVIDSPNLLEKLFKRKKGQEQLSKKNVSFCDMVFDKMRDIHKKEYYLLTEKKWHADWTNSDVYENTAVWWNNHWAQQEEEEE